MKKLSLFLILLTFTIPTAFADVYIDNDHKYLGDDGTLHILGEIINESNKPINQVEVTAVFYFDLTSIGNLFPQSHQYVKYLSTNYYLCRFLNHYI